MMKNFYLIQTHIYIYAQWCLFLYIQIWFFNILANTIATIRNTLGESVPKAEPVKAAPMKITRQSGDLQRLVNEVKGQVKKIGITGN